MHVFHLSAGAEGENEAEGGMFADTKSSCFLHPLNWYPDHQSQLLFVIQVQKEREAEGDQYADKEKFVTSAYRKKMEEQAREEEEEQRMARIEAALDVTKQNDLSGFYRHIYR